MTGTVGQSAVRVDAHSKVTGSAKYPSDLSMPGMLHGKILFAGRPHARVLAIDDSAALAEDGVVAVLTASDVPVNEYGLQTPDQPVLCGPGSTAPNAEVVRFVGDQVAVIVAKTEQAAARGRDLVHVEYEDLPVLSDPFEAMRPGAPLLHPDRQPNPVHPEMRTEGNVICHHQIRKGDVENAWEQAEVIVEGSYFTPSQEHVYLQPEAGLSYIDEDDRVTVICAGQWTWEDQREIAHALALQPEQVRVQYAAIGGAFGGREDMSLQIVLALAAYKLRRPIRIVWNREESIIGHCKRHAMWFECKLGATRDGRLVAAQVSTVADGGAYCYTTNKVLGNTAITCTGPYAIPNIKIDIDGIYTNNLPGGAFRGFGAPQGAFVAEMQMNKLAEALEIDPVELRTRNLLRDGDSAATGTPLPGGVSLVEVTEQCARAAGWTQGAGGWKRPSAKGSRLGQRRGLGIAVGFKNVGFSFGYQENCWAKVELRGQTEIEQALVYIGSADVGQGSHTVICQIAAEALGIATGSVQIVASDTASSPGSSGSASASRSTYMAGNAILGSAQEALRRWQDGDRPAVADHTYLAPQTTPYDPVNGQGTPNFAYGYVAEAVEVEVDQEIGLLRILNVTCADDVGRAINPRLVEGQIEGGIAQAVGWSTCEDFILDRGYVMTPHLSTYLMPTVVDVPDRITSIILEKPDPSGPHGARGVGEMPFIPLAPALVAAVHSATSVWFDKIPLTPERILSGIRAVPGSQPEDG
jgi:CO/xanthine dehydrogenase Mo-binding subunit